MVAALQVPVAQLAGARAAPISSGHFAVVPVVAATHEDDAADVLVAAWGRAAAGQEEIVTTVDAAEAASGRVAFALIAKSSPFYLARQYGFCRCGLLDIVPAGHASGFRGAVKACVRSRCAVL